MTLHLSRDGLRRIDKYPYQAAIASGVKLVMVSWAPDGPPDCPLPSLAGELRQRLGFAGVTITDALEAGRCRRSARPGSAQRWRPAPEWT